MRNLAPACGRRALILSASLIALASAAQAQSVTDYSFDGVRPISESEFITNMGSDFDAVVSAPVLRNSSYDLADSNTSYALDDLRRTELAGVPGYESPAASSLDAQVNVLPVSGEAHSSLSARAHTMLPDMDMAQANTGSALKRTVSGASSGVADGSDIPGVTRPALPAHMNPSQSTARAGAIQGTANPAWSRTQVTSVTPSNSPASDLPPLAQLRQGERDLSVTNNQDVAYHDARRADEKGLGFDLDVMIGAGVAWHPDYMGSDDYELDFIPIFEIDYLDRFFLSSRRGLGVVLFQGEGLDASVQANWRRGRKATGDIASLADVDGGVSLASTIGYTTGPLRLETTLDYAVSGDDLGLRVDADAIYSQALTPKLVGKAWGGARFGNDDYADAYFGTPGYDPDGGLMDLHAGIGATYKLSANFALNGTLDGSLLMGDAADSPIVDTVGSRTQLRGTLSATYRF